MCPPVPFMLVGKHLPNIGRHVPVTSIITQGLADSRPHVFTDGMANISYIRVNTVTGMIHYGT